MRPTPSSATRGRLQRLATVCVVLIGLCLPRGVVSYDKWGYRECMGKSTSKEYYNCMGWGDEDKAWYSQCSDREKYQWPQVMSKWLQEGTPMASWYTPKLTINCSSPDNPPSEATPAPDMLNAYYLKRDQMGYGAMESHITGLYATWKWTVDLDADARKADPTFAAIMNKPFTWTNFQRCLPWGPEAHSRDSWNGGGTPWCPASMTQRKCKLTLDLVSNDKDALCLVGLHGEWQRDGDLQCSIEGRQIQAVPLTINLMYDSFWYDDDNGVNYHDAAVPLSPYFAARRIVYQRWVNFNLPTKVPVGVPNGKYAIAVESYVNKDANAFSGIRLAVDAVSNEQYINCPAGTWLTCEKKPANGVVGETHICTYPAALKGSTPSQWRADIAAYYDEIGDRSNEIVQVYRYTNADNKNPLEEKIPGLDGTTCFPCRTAAGKTHFGESLNHLSNEHETDKVLDFYCPGSYHPPSMCPFNKVVPFDPVTGVAKSTSCACDNGYKPDGDSCVVCSPGTYCNVLDAYDRSGDNWRVNDKRPIDCSSGTYSGGKASQCLPCNTEESVCSERQRLSACLAVPGPDSKTRTQYLTRDARCVSCLSCTSMDPTVGIPCLGATQDGLFT